MAMLRWVYTDELELSEDDAFLIELMKLANRFQLQVLRERSEIQIHFSCCCWRCIEHYVLMACKIHLFPCWHRCEKGVMSSVNVRNCIRFYQTAEELNAATLMNYCGEIIASHWVSNVRHWLYVAAGQSNGSLCINVYNGCWLSVRCLDYVIISVF